MKTFGRPLTTALATALCSSALLLSTPSYADPDYCVGGTPSGGIALSDVTFGIPADSASAADDCWGTSSGGSAGNDSVDAINALKWDEFGGDDFNDWVRVAKSDNPGGGGDFWFDEFAFMVGVPPGTDPWSYSLAWIDTDPSNRNLPQSGDIVFVGKQANGFAAYLFEDITFATGQTGGGTFSITFADNNPGFSHVSIYVRGSTPNDGGACLPGACDATLVPEPGTLALLGLGLLGLAGRPARRTSGL